MLGVWNKSNFVELVGFVCRTAGNHGLFVNGEGEMDDDLLFWWTVHMFSK